MPWVRRLVHFGLASAGLVLVLSLGVLFAGVQRGGTTLPPGAVGSAVPMFTLEDVQGHEVSLADYQGRVVVLYFHSTRCPASNRQAGQVSRFLRQYAGDPRVQMLGVHRGGSGQIREIIAQAKVLGWEFPTLIDAGGEVAQAFAVHQWPKVIVIDEHGVVRHRGPVQKVGESDEPFEEVVRKLLTEQPGGVAHSQRVVAGAG